MFLWLKCDKYIEINTESTKHRTCQFTIVTTKIIFKQLTTINQLIKRLQATKGKYVCHSNLGIRHGMSCYETFKCMTTVSIISDHTDKPLHIH